MTQPGVAPHRNNAYPRGLPDHRLAQNTVLGLAEMTGAIPAQMSLVALAQHCRVEGERFGQGVPHDDSFAYELFRRALVERCDAAWVQLYDTYFPLVRRWVLDCNAFTVSGETCPVLVNAAFTRFWQAIPRDRFAAFTGTSALLAYLRRCAHCAVVDAARTHHDVRSLDLTQPVECEAAEHLEHDTVQRISSEQIWQIVERQTHNLAEWVILAESFAYGLKPSAIFRRHPDMFATVSCVYQIKRSLLARLARCPDLRQMAD
jgi:DNA-directed RNA polymerase specialized sigma24 family protein